MIRQICEKEKVQNIIEEMSNEGLKKIGVQGTIVRKIALGLCIKSSYIDLNSKQRQELRVSDEQIRNIALRERNAEFSSMRNLLTNKLLHPIREIYWLSYILEKDIWPTLFVCGSDHGNAKLNK